MIFIQTEKFTKEFSIQNNIEHSVSTHLGHIPIREMGVTLIHEHVFNKFPIKEEKISNEFITTQLQSIRKWGVTTIVDLTPYTSLDSYQEILKTNILYIICCLGFYLDKYIPFVYRKYSIDQLVDKMSQQIKNGRCRSKIYPGILKVAGGSQCFTQSEKKFFKTISLLQQEHRLPIATHSPRCALQHMEFLLKEGTNMEHVFFSHVDKGIHHKDNSIENNLLEILKILEVGSYVLFSEFGSIYHSAILKKNVSLMKKIKDAGYIGQLLISADSNWRWKNGQIVLKGYQWGGVPRTYEYVFKQIIPALQQAGFTEKDVEMMLVSNPLKLFKF